MPKVYRLDFDRPFLAVPRMFITISNSGANADYIKVVKPLRAIARKHAYPMHVSGCVRILTRSLKDEIHPSHPSLNPSLSPQHDNIHSKIYPPNLRFLINVNLLIAFPAPLHLI